MLTRAVCDEDRCSEVEHGHSYFFKHGEPGKYAKTIFTGPTFHDDDKTHATIETVLEVARSRKSWPPEGLDMDELRKLIAAEVARREVERKQERGMSR